MRAFDSDEKEDEEILAELDASEKTEEQATASTDHQNTADQKEEGDELPPEEENIAIETVADTEEAESNESGDSSTNENPEASHEQSSDAQFTAEMTEVPNEPVKNENSSAESDDNRAEEVEGDSDISEDLSSDEEDESHEDVQDTPPSEIAEEEISLDEKEVGETFVKGVTIEEAEVSSSLEEEPVIGENLEVEQDLEDTSANEEEGQEKTEVFTQSDLEQLLEEAKEEELYERPLWKKFIITLSFIIPLSAIMSGIQVYFIIRNSDGTYPQLPFYEDLNTFFSTFLPLGEFTTAAVAFLLLAIYLLIAYIDARVHS